MAERSTGRPSLPDEWGTADRSGDPDLMLRLRARSLAIRREAIIALMPRTNRMKTGDRVLMKEAFETVHRPVENDVMGADLLTMSRYQQMRIVELVNLYVQRSLWEFERRPDGSLPAAEDSAERRRNNQAALEGLARGLYAALPLADLIPRQDRGYFLNALRLINHWGADGLREETWFGVATRIRWNVEAVIEQITGHPVAYFVPSTPFVPAATAFPALPDGIFDLYGFDIYCRELAVTAAARADAERYMREQAEASEDDCIASNPTPEERPWSTSPN